MRICKHRKSLCAKKYHPNVFSSLQSTIPGNPIQAAKVPSKCKEREVSPFRSNSLGCGVLSMTEAVAFGTTARSRLPTADENGKLSVHDPRHRSRRDQRPILISFLSLHLRGSQYQFHRMYGFILP
uniref:Uncharacterized protein n=1 Tax=Physcomitrium patens TaxID=3218 RepID=A0A2K1K020_PHYPA|nr:hypothetical protein PHYPA_014243 [Physcomitrium patens]